jgi:DNA polymerase IIIc chi subunit
MTISKLTQVFFIRVNDNIAKVQKLCSLIHSHFVKNEKVLIAVPSNDAAVYIDKLLWRMPEESFIPHAIANSSTKERIAITTSLSNVNQASVLFNLHPNILPQQGPLDLIYELLDLTSKEKEEFSRKKQSDYRSAGHHVEEIL